MPEKGPSKATRLFKDMPKAPEGADEGMNILREINGEEIVDNQTPEKLPIESIDLDGKSAISLQEEPEEEDEILEEEPEEDEEDDQEKALEMLPTQEQKQLKGIDPKLVSDLAKGPSSLVDQDVVANLTKLPKEQQLKFWEMILSPRQALAQFKAEGDERKAKATIRAEIAKTTLSAAEFAAQDLNSKVFRSFIDQLRNTYDLAKFCEEHGIEQPQTGTLQEAHILMQNHFAWLAQAKRNNEIKKQLDIYIEKKTQLQGEIAMERMRAEMLPQLKAVNLQKQAALAVANAQHLPAVIEAREVEYPLVRKAWAQKVSHASGLVVGTPVVAVVGAVLHPIGMTIVAAKEEIDKVAQGLAIAKEKAAEGWEEVKEQIEESRARRAQKSKRSNG